MLRLILLLLNTIVHSVLFVMSSINVIAIDVIVLFEVSLWTGVRGLKTYKIS